MNLICIYPEFKFCDFSLYYYLKIKRLPTYIQLKLIHLSMCLPLTVNQFLKKVSTRMSSAIPLSWYVFKVILKSPRNLLSSSTSSNTSDLCIIWSRTDDRGLHPTCMMLSMYARFLQLRMMWILLLFPSRHRGQIVTLPEDSATASDALYASLLPKPTFMHLNLVITLKHLLLLRKFVGLHHIVGTMVSCNNTSLQIESWISS